MLYSSSDAILMAGVRNLMSVATSATIMSIIHITIRDFSRRLICLFADICLLALLPLTVIRLSVWRKTQTGQDSTYLSCPTFHPQPLFDYCSPEYATAILPVATADAGSGKASLWPHGTQCFISWAVSLRWRLRISRALTLLMCN